jgi:hypothetical protein
MAGGIGEGVEDEKGEPAAAQYQRAAVVTGGESGAEDTRGIGAPAEVT